MIGSEDEQINQRLDAVAAVRRAFTFFHFCGRRRKMRKEMSQAWQQLQEQ
jgi:hypothetical protein